MDLASALPQDHHAIIAPIARAVASRYRHLAALDELQQLGAVAAIAVVADLDVTRAETSKRAYLRLRIRGAMLDPIRRELGRREVSQNCDDLPLGQPTRTMDGFLALLPARERQILELRLQGWSQAETGVRLRISQSRVSRIEARAVRMLRKRAGVDVERN